ncbi:phosphoribosyltransferase [Candidatus Falkowbacteria bacterium CG10_big_fil_rev_8_21_14_0_10_43_11]|uniref:Phosphoribosyltransferase n=1 Tax=Candidatus Falkowbacteria bacterium CG10_big_fil_rev_8_21_14_0_10_43_11 TaxID=1974568 RepID=A0A2M6WLK1_9BACT|nr:MAG: phosphoribosyltransferase [Candidatus Falkowbacteria bacterium CG10_big_fil_rev_8_21_14_0_10_43_11]
MGFESGNIMELSEPQVMEILRKRKALIEGHFVGKSGKHLDTYVLKDAIYPYSDISTLCRSLAWRFRRDFHFIEAVVGPVVGGVSLSQWVAHWLREFTKREVLALFADKDPDKGFIIGRGYERLIQYKRTLVVEDILTTGGSAAKTIEVARTFNAHVIALGVLCNRGGVTPESVNAPEIFALANLNLPSWEARDCPLCAAGKEVNTELGHGKEFLASLAV